MQLFSTCCSNAYLESPIYEIKNIMMISVSPTYSTDEDIIEMSKYIYWKVVSIVYFWSGLVQPSTNNELQNKQKNIIEEINLN